MTTVHHYSLDEFIKYLITDKRNPEARLFDRHMAECPKCRALRAKVAESI